MRVEGERGEGLLARDVDVLYASFSMLNASVCATAVLGPAASRAAFLNVAWDLQQPGTHRPQGGILTWFGCSHSVPGRRGHPSSLVRWPWFTDGRDLGGVGSSRHRFPTPCAQSSECRWRGAVGSSETRDRRKRKKKKKHTVKSISTHVSPGERATRAQRIPCGRDQPNQPPAGHSPPGNLVGSIGGRADRGDRRSSLAQRAHDDVSVQGGRCQGIHVTARPAPVCVRYLLWALLLPYAPDSAAPAPAPAPAPALLGTCLAGPNTREPGGPGKGRRCTGKSTAEVGGSGYR